MPFPLIVGIAARIVTNLTMGPDEPFPGELTGIKIVIAG
jgi:hypothetical protein